MNLLLVGLTLLVYCAAIGTTGTTPIEDVSTTTDQTTTLSAKTSTSSTQTTTPAGTDCKDENTTCEKCLARGTQCYFCKPTKKCAFYPYGHIVPRYEECGSMGDMSWGTCAVNFEILIIAMSVIGGILILGLIICCCCCCRKRGRDKWAKQQAKWERDREERKARNEERKKERQAKTDEIRRKYGLKIGDDNPYQRFDA